ncbi:MAG TPA: N-acetylglucosamine-6-phosphate deacetylase [Firmicutes bacterium]|nr:N-acetylglucosamine-6-phosphate deacetylase [Bacillota bacterium]
MDLRLVRGLKSEELGRALVLEWSGGVITKVAEATGPIESDLSVVLPGLVDLQVNGFADYDVNDPAVTPATIVGMARALWATGVTSFCPTITTQSFERMLRSVRAVAEACNHAAVEPVAPAAVGPAPAPPVASSPVDPALLNHSILGIHLEGPYVSGEDGPRGAHPAEWVRDPDWDEFQRWQEAAEGRIRLVTLAPERPGAIQFIRKLVSTGVVVAIGHTAATTDQIRAAIDAGATLSTHLGNGAHALIRRHPNYIWDQLAADELSAGLIVDGHHLPPAVVKVFWRAKGEERLFLVSDAVAIAGLPPGRYTALGQQVELTPEGRVNLLGTEYLAGSALQLRRAVMNFMQFTGVPFARAWALASTRPAALLGRGRDLGQLAPGYRADFVLIDREALASRGEVRVLATFVAGEKVYEAGAQ